MNTETHKLIEVLASKLGTTAEHLWSVLVRQAPMSAFTDSMLLIALWVVARHILKLAHSMEDNFDRPPVIVIAWGVVVILAVFTACAVSEIIPGFINPEYWALRQLLGVSR